MATRPMYIFDLVSNRISTLPAVTVPCSAFVWYGASSQSTSSLMSYTADSVKLAESLMRNDLIVRYRFNSGPWITAKFRIQLDNAKYSPYQVQYIFPQWQPGLYGNTGFAYAGPEIYFVREGNINGVSQVEPPIYPIVAGVIAGQTTSFEQGHIPSREGIIEVQAIDPDTGVTLFNAAQTYFLPEYTGGSGLTPEEIDKIATKYVKIRGGLRPIGLEYPGTGPGSMFVLENYVLATETCPDAAYTEPRVINSFGVAVVNGVAPNVGGETVVVEELFEFTGPLLGRTSTGASTAWATTSNLDTFWNLVSAGAQGSFVKGSTYSEGLNEHTATFPATSFASLELSVDLSVSPSLNTTTFPRGDEVVLLEIYDNSNRFNAYASIGVFVRNENGSAVTFGARAEIYFYIDSNTEVYDFAFFDVPLGTVSLRLETTATSITAYANNTAFLTVNTTLHAPFDASGLAISHNIVDLVPGVIQRLSVVSVDDIYVKALT